MVMTGVKMYSANLKISRFGPPIFFFFLSCHGCVDGADRYGSDRYSGSLIIKRYAEIINFLHALKCRQTFRRETDLTATHANARSRGLNPPAARVLFVR